MYGNALFHIAAEAVTPEQLVHYVRAVSGRRAVAAGGYAAYVHEGHAVLVAYGQNAREHEGSPQGTPGSSPPSLGPALEELAPACGTITVLAPFRPAEAPENASVNTDRYWQIPLPAEAPGQKLRNMLRRASREVTIGREDWGQEHAALVRRYLTSRPLLPGTRRVFEALDAYVGSGPEGVLLLAARREGGGLAAFLIGDCTGLHTAFYMFAFRQPDAPPGAADLLLHSLMTEAEQRGHSRVNLGLGINDGIAFFKKKWGAVPFLPYVETTWALEGPKAPARSILRALFGIRQGIFSL